MALKIKRVKNLKLKVQEKSNRTTKFWKIILKGFKKKKKKDH